MLHFIFNLLCQYPSPLSTLRSGKLSCGVSRTNIKLNDWLMHARVAGLFTNLNAYNLISKPLSALPYPSPDPCFIVPKGHSLWFEMHCE